MASASGLTFKLHPLVILNISDHHTRIRAQNSGPNPNSGGGYLGLQRVLGCVMGIQTGRTVEIFNSFELKYDLKDTMMSLESYDQGATSSFPSGQNHGEIVIDRGFLETKIEQYKKVFPKYDVLGWYSTGSGVHDSDMQIHKTLMEINESPVYVLLNPTINPSGKDLPISIYESELHVIEGVPSLIFVSSSYTIETVEAERISVDHVAHIKPSDGSSAATQLAAHLTGMHSAIKMLHAGIKLLQDLLLAMQKGDVPYEHSLLRQVASLVRRLPAVDSPKFQEDFLMEYNDTLLMTYLASITKGTSAINELVDKFNVAHEKHGRRAGRATFS